MAVNPFILDLGADIDRVAEDLNFVWKSATVTLFSRVIIGTPVKTGYARSGWRVGESVDDMLPAALSNEEQGERPAPSVSFDEIPDVGGTVFLFANVDYLEYLEDGTSDQRPNGWVAQEVEKWDEIVEGVNRFV